MDVPASAEPLIITDAAINIFPTLDDKRDICQNAIDLARVLGFNEPKVAVLSAVETVTEKIPSTLVAAALCKMADRGRPRRWTTGVRQRGERGGRTDEKDRLACRGQGEHPPGPRPRGGEHAGQ